MEWHNNYMCARIQFYNDVCKVYFVNKLILRYINGIIYNILT